jgi:hypothetical protein
MSNAVAIGALLFSVLARLSLRRNRGFVPAQREIVTAGAYRFVRHPIGCAENLQPTQYHALGHRRFLDARQETSPRRVFSAPTHNTPPT